MKSIVLFILLTLLGYNTKAQTEKESVATAVRNYVDAFYYGDTTKIHQSISKTVVKYGYFIPKGTSGYKGEPMSFKEMVEYAARVGKRGTNPKVDQYPKIIDVFDVLDQTASAKLTAWWGTDYLLLAKQDGRWMITNVVWQSTPK